MSNSEQMIQVCQTTNQTDAEVIRLLLGSRGIHCVVEPGNKVMVKKPMAEKAKRLVKGNTRCLSG